MNYQNINAILVFCVAVMSICVFGVIFLISVSRKKRDKKIKFYDSINSQLKENKQFFFNYDKINDFLISHGVPYHFPFITDPVRFVSYSLITGFLLFFFGSLFNMYMGVLLLIVGILLPYTLIKEKDKEDNNLIMEDVKLVYSALYNQIKAGVFIINALEECSSGYGTNQMIKNERFAKEMQLLSSDIYLTSNVTTSLEKFTKKFNNIYLVSLSVVISQAMESGLASEALLDITEQLKEVEKNLLFLKKEKKQLRNLLYELLFLGGIFAVIFTFILPEIMNIVNFI